MSFLKKNIVLNDVAKCKIIVNNNPSFLSKELPKITFDISICPLDDIGKNSVKPCTMPNKKASK
jgi:hypothetical protein